MSHQAVHLVGTPIVTSGHGRSNTYPIYSQSSMDIFGYEVSFLYLVLGVILLIVLTAGGFLSRSGLFYTITLRFSCPTPEVMPQRVAYIQAKGPYKNSGLLFRQTMDVSTNAKIFGIYYDDPSKVSLVTVLSSILGFELSMHLEAPGL